MHEKIYPKHNQSLWKSIKGGFKFSLKLRRKKPKQFIFNLYDIKGECFHCDKQKEHHRKEKVKKQKRQAKIKGKFKNVHGTVYALGK
jgi:hypothetical protein